VAVLNYRRKVTASAKVKINKEKLKQANKKALKGFLGVLPIIFGMLLIVSMINTLVPKSLYSRVFSGNIISDSFVGALLGSILTGNPVSAYILGDGFLKNGVGLIAVTAFLTSWTTVGLIQLPAESMVLGKKFAIYRNISAFAMSIVTAIITVYFVSLLR